MGCWLAKAVVSIALLTTFLFAQQSSTDNTVEPMNPIPTMHVNVVARDISAVNYWRKALTKVDFRGTELMPAATGEANVAGRGGRTAIDAKLQGLQPPQKFGLEYLTYVLWAISPEGRPTNVAEILLDNGKSEVKATTDLQAFGMIVTAEPHFAVTQPSDVVVLENVVRPDTKGVEHPISAHYELLPRGMYLAAAEPMRNLVYGVDNGVPLDLLEARNAMRIARNAGAEQYATASYQKAQQLLDQAEDYYWRKQPNNSISMTARHAAQTAEEARVMSLRRQHEEQIAQQQRELEEQATQAKLQADLASQRAADAASQAETEAQRRAQAEAEREAAQQAKLQAEDARQQAEAATQQAELRRQQAEQERLRIEQERQQAEAAKGAALQQQEALRAQAQQAQLQAQQAEQARIAAEREHEQTRARLLQQLSSVLQTKDTAAGLVANMPDVLFDFGKATLRSSAKVRLAKVAGIILAYPDLHLKIEGFTDNIGSDAYNVQLSEKRAANVRDFLISQGVPVNNVVAQGFGKAEPIASNATPQGRQLNRRVDVVVSGEAIGTRAGSPATSATTSTSGGTTGAAGAAGNNGGATSPTSGNAAAVGSPTSAPPPQH